MLKNIGIAILVLIFLGVIFGESETSENPAKSGLTSNSAKTEDKKVEVIEITSITLSKEYEQNEISADNKYKGKFVKVTGTINDIGKDILDNMYITLKGSDFMGGVQVYFNDEDGNTVANLSKNTRITVVCKVDGLMMNVLCNDAVVVKQ